MRVGIDAQSVAEVGAALTAHGDRYLRRVYSSQELEDCAAGTGAGVVVASLAARFAAKEAVLKVLREIPEVPAWPEIEVVTSPGGWPLLRLHGVAADLAARAGLSELEVSLSHTADTAVAVVIAR